MRLSRREFVGAAAAASGALWLGPVAQSEPATSGGLHLAPFRFDVTPPVGHSCCGGWIKPVEVVDDPLEAIGFVLLGAGKPVVVVAVDWTGILNSAHLQWREALADAAGTTPDRVAVQCVHQHNAPFACLDTERLVAAQGDLPHIVDVDFFARVLERGAKTVRTAVQQAEPVTHLATGRGRVERVAANRRIVNEQGELVNWRGSSSTNPLHHELPEGLIDPWLRTVAFYNGERKLAACHYYATHPMSFYADGRVTSDFAGLARKRRQQEEPGCTHIYFTGCSGNVAAGKYNNGSPQARVDLTERMYQGILASEEHLQPEPIGEIQWRTLEVLPPTRESLDAAAIERQLADRQAAVVARSRPAYSLAWLQRAEAQTPLVLSSLSLGDVSLLHLPAESFVEYQLLAQALAPQRFVATAAYGDGGPWYVPTAESYPQGGYEVSVAWCAAGVDAVWRQGIRSLLGAE